MVALALWSCGGVSPSRVSPNESSSSSAQASTTSVAVACGPTQENCTAAQVISTVARLYEIGGATPTEAACLAPITGQGKHAVNQAFDKFSDAETRASIECVGSKRRLYAIEASLGRWFVKHPRG